MHVIGSKRQYVNEQHYLLSLFLFIVFVVGFGRGGYVARKNQIRFVTFIIY